MLTATSNLLYETWRETRFYYCQPYKRIYEFTMDLVPNGSKNLLKLKLLKRKNHL